MSDHFLVVIPVDPKAPLPDTAPAVRDALAEIAACDEVRIKDYGKLQFIDCGENFNQIQCPGCQGEISVEQWHVWMDEDWHGAEGFHLHRHATPCCSAHITLNELIYDWPQGFSRWFVSARNPGRPPLTDIELAHLSEVADLPLRAISQMY